MSADAPSGRGFETDAIHAGQPADPDHRRGGHADHLATTFAQDAVGKHAGLRVRPHRQPDPCRARGVPRRPSRARRVASRSRAGWPPRTRCSARSCGPATTWCSRSTRTAARSARRARLRRGRRRLDRGRPLATRRRWPTCSAPRRAWCGSRRRRTRRSASSTSTRSRGSPTPVTARGRGRQHVRDAVPPDAARARRRHRRALDHEVPRRSLRHARRVRRGARRRARRAHRVPPERDGRGAGAVRRLPRAAGDQDARGAHGPPLRERGARSRRCSTRTPRSTGCSTRASRRTRATRSRPGRCAAFGGMVSFLAAGGRTPRSRSRAPPSCSRWPSRSARSSRSSSIPGRMTHASAAGSPLEVDPALIRLSVGLESVADLVADLAHALDAVTSAAPLGRSARMMTADRGRDAPRLLAVRGAPARDPRRGARRPRAPARVR